MAKISMAMQAVFEHEQFKYDKKSCKKILKKSSLVLLDFMFSGCVTMKLIFKHASTLSFSSTMHYYFQALRATANTKCINVKYAG